IRRLRPLEDAAGINAHLTPGIPDACTVAHQPAGLGEDARATDRWDGVPRRQVCDLDAPVEEESAAADEQSVRPLARESREGSIELGDSAGVETADLYCHGARSRFYVSQVGRSNRRLGRIEWDGHTFDGGHELTQKLQPLGRQLGRKKVDPGRVAAGTREAGD